MSQVYVSGVSSNASEDNLKKAIREVFLKATNNLAFLKKGDLVLLKPALNSPDAYPATTHPLALQVVAEIIKEKGGKVVAGDQSGMEHVVFLPGRKEGSSKDNYDKSGMGNSGVDFKAFENEGYEDGYKHFVSDKTLSWPNGFYVTNWIDRVDHIINLPRISTHAMAGITLGLKNMVGILRCDSRLEFHADGPYSGIFKFNKLKINHKNAQKFAEKIVEINLAVKNKLRASLFIATEVQTTFGPDNKVIKVLKANKVKPEKGLIFASSDPVSADLFALGFLSYLFREKTSIFAKLSEKILLFQASKYHKLCKESPCDNEFIKYAVKLGLGDSNISINWSEVDNYLREKIEKIIS